MKYYEMSNYSDFMMTFENTYPFNDTPLEEAKKAAILKGGMKRLYDDQGRWIATITYDKENPLPDGDIPLQDLELTLAGMEKHRSLHRSQARTDSMMWNW